MIRPALLLSALLALALPVAVGAASPAAGAADPALMVLKKSDFTRATVESEGYEDVDDPKFEAAYSREFENVVYRGKTYPAIGSSASVAKTVGTARTEFVQTERAVRSKRGREQIRQLFAELAEDLPDAKVTVGPPRSLRAGDQSFALPISISSGKQTFSFLLALYRFDRVLGSLILATARKPEFGPAALLAQLSARRTRLALTPANLAPPAVSGTAQEGFVLTGVPGTWRGGAGLTYRWLRCNAAGASCVPVAGATGLTYTVTAADIGSTLRFEVSMRSRLGAASARSAPTAVVTVATGPPVNTVPPTVSGNARVGQTLTVATGSWTGTQPAFALQWQRCDATAAQCIDLPGFSATTYVVQPADVGYRLRVRVLAANPSGTTTVFTAPSPMVVA